MSHLREHDDEPEGSDWPWWVDAVRIGIVLVLLIGVIWGDDMWRSLT